MLVKSLRRRLECCISSESALNAIWPTRQREGRCDGHRLIRSRSKVKGIRTRSRFEATIRRRPTIRSDRLATGHRLSLHGSTSVSRLSLVVRKLDFAVVLSIQMFHRSRISRPRYVRRLSSRARGLMRAQIEASKRGQRSAERQRTFSFGSQFRFRRWTNNSGSWRRLRSSSRGWRRGWRR